MMLTISSPRAEVPEVASRPISNLILRKSALAIRSDRDSLRTIITPRKFDSMRPTATHLIDRKKV